MQRPYNTVNTAIKNYLNNEEAICTQYPDAYIILHDTQILGPYSTIYEAYHEAFARYEIGTFLVKYCGEINDGKKQ